ncbi:MAG: hypothetical protein AB7P67_05490 [Vicinamibacterales bacterium]
MTARLLVATLATLATLYGACVYSREGRFTPGAPIAGVFGHFESADACDSLPQDQLFVITPTEFHAVYDGRWWRGRVEHRHMLLAWNRPGLLLRVTTEAGAGIELVFEVRDEGRGRLSLETVFEQTVEPGVGRINRPRRADRSIFRTCLTEPASRPWLAATD